MHTIENKSPWPLSTSLRGLGGTKNKPPRVTISPCCYLVLLGLFSWKNQRTNTCMRFLCGSSRIHNKKDSPTPNNVRSMAFSLHAFLHLVDLFQTFFFLNNGKNGEKTETELIKSKTEKNRTEKKMSRTEPNQNLGSVSVLVKNRTILNRTQPYLLILFI